jgi:hypothetical protein
MTLQMLPKPSYSPDLSVVVESRPVADIDVSWWRETAVLTLRAGDTVCIGKG